MGFPRSGGCVECERLAANLAEAAKIYFAILTKIQLARTGNNTAQLAELEALESAAAERRSQARTELRRHEATHRIANGQSA